MSELKHTGSPAGSFSILRLMVDTCLSNRLVVVLVGIMICAWGIVVAPFDWQTGILPRDPVPVDAIPDIGENQQIVFIRWDGRSPQDVEDQVTYPMTVTLLGLPGVKTVRSYSMFGFSSIYVIFDEDIEYYWSRSRILEKLNSLPQGLLPTGVNPVLGPDATALGQVFWYTLEGLNPDGQPAGGWDLEELRSIQDWYVRYALMSTQGVAEVASVGGFQKEYQIDVDPDALKAFGVSLDEVFMAVRHSNSDVGARTIEINKVEYVIRGTGFIKSIDDIEKTVIKVRDNTPVYISNVAQVTEGPAARRGALDKEGSEAVGGVVIVRYGENPQEVINRLKEKMDAIRDGLPSKTLPDGSISKVTIVPFYDRTELIQETLNTLNDALSQEILITCIVIILLLGHFRSSILVGGMLPVAVLGCFIVMKYTGVDANIVALSGIAIAIGTMVDMGIVVSENILVHVRDRECQDPILVRISRAVTEVGGAVITAVTTTVISFLPVFAMEAAEGKLFRPLAFTKTFALLISLGLALYLIPVLASLVMRVPGKIENDRRNMWCIPVITGIMLLVSAAVCFFSELGTRSPIPMPMALTIAGTSFIANGLLRMASFSVPQKWSGILGLASQVVLALGAIGILSKIWMPLGQWHGTGPNFLFISICVFGVVGLFGTFDRFFPLLMAWVFRLRILFGFLMVMVVFVGAMIWLGAGALLGESGIGRKLTEVFPGTGREFMPNLDEGSYLYMPTTMPHASIGESMDAMRIQDMAMSQIPEVRDVVGKLGRADTALDPAPISMVETIINYYSEFLEDAQGNILRFEFDESAIDYFRNFRGEAVPAPDGDFYKVKGEFKRDQSGNLIESTDGKPFRIWRSALDPDLNDGRDYWEGIRSPDDIWAEIVRVAEVPGSTSAPRLQPIAARLVMLQSGMRAPMGIKIMGPNLEVIEKFGLDLERALKGVESVEPAAVIADRIVGKPYLEIAVDREALSRYGIQVDRFQQVIQLAVGGVPVTRTVEGRERYNIRIRYQRELRDQIESIKRILVSSSDGIQIPLEQLSSIQYRRGPQNIKSENTFLVGYVLFDAKPGYAEVDVVNDSTNHLENLIDQGKLVVPQGVTYQFAGNYENQIRSEKRLAVIIPLALIFIFLILYIQFKSASESLMVFISVALAWAGGFILLWLYGQPWFLDIDIWGFNLRELFQIKEYNLSVAVWVGFLALFGIATDNGVLMATVLTRLTRDRQFQNSQDIVGAVIEAARLRVRPCIMTTSTTILALVPVLMSTGRGADVMIPMAIPSAGGMAMVFLSLLLVPMIYGSVKEFALRTRLPENLAAIISVATLFIVPVIFCGMASIVPGLWTQSAQEIE